MQGEGEVDRARSTSFSTDLSHSPHHLLACHQHDQLLQAEAGAFDCTQEGIFERPKFLKLKTCDVEPHGGERR